MKHKLLPIFLIALSSFTLINCDEEELLHASCDEAVFATVRDLTGLDGCGFVFELADGTTIAVAELVTINEAWLPKFMQS